MATGTVKWFNPTKGYGFIQPQGGGKDVFVHISAVERAGLSTLNEGQTVHYEIVSNRGKESAENLKVGRFQVKGWAEPVLLLLFSDVGRARYRRVPRQAKCPQARSLGLGGANVSLIFRPRLRAFPSSLLLLGF